MVETPNDARTLLITLIGRDRPGVTTRVFDAVARFSGEVVDIEQIVVRGRLVLGILIAEPRDTAGLASIPGGLAARARSHARPSARHRRQRRVAARAAAG